MIRRAVLGVGGLAVVAAVILALVPLHHEGVSGNALGPSYRGFGWVSYSPLPAHATIGELRAAGVQIPAYVASSRAAVRQRREAAGIVGGVGVVLVLGGLLVRPRSGS